MNKSRIKKLILYPSGAFLGALTIFISSPYTYRQKTNFWYENLNNEKFEVRGQGTTIALNQNNEAISIPANNDFELKLLLNPGFETENEEFLTKFNNDFINKVNQNNLIYKSFEKLSIMPIVWFYFENETDRENFVNKIKDWNEIYKFIIFENKNTSPQNYTSQSYGSSSAYLYNQSIKTNNYMRYGIDSNLEKYKQSVNKNIDITNASGYLDNSYVNKVGVLEAWAYPFDKNYQKHFKGGIEINDLNDKKDDYYKSHSTFVSMIVGSKHGIDKTSKIHLHTFNKFDGQWMSIIEKMVKEEGIRLINHSYGYTMRYDVNGTEKIHPKYLEGYSENAYFLDYITRKYGVINVFSASNEGKDDHHLITGPQLSFNSVIVGALSDWSTKTNLKYNTVADYSNYRLHKEYENISKPLVVAPAYFYDPVYNVNEYEHGTSYAAPVVTGLISNLLKYRSDIRNSDYKIPIVKAVLSASAVSPNHDNLTYKSSGYEQKFGAGTVDFKTMLEAANNYSTLKIHPTNDSGFVFSSKEINLKKNQTIKISSSWMFNAGLLNQSEVRPEYKENTSWWNSFLNFFSPSRKRSQELEKQKTIAEGKIWDLSHKSEIRLTQSEAIKRQNNNWFSDYDLYLEKKESNGKWVVVKMIQSAVSNDELLEYKATSSGTYRYRIKKYEKYDFSNSVYDLIATTHVVKNE